MNREAFERIKRGFEERYDEISQDASKLVKSMMLNTGRELTKDLIFSIQRDIDLFLEKHKLNIKVNVISFEDQVVLMGSTLEDELVWESVTRIIKY